jgi:hypothetical protein
MVSNASATINGPTPVATSDGSPTFNSLAAPLSDDTAQRLKSLALRDRLGANECQSNEMEG